MNEYLIKYEQWFGIKGNIKLYADNKREAEEEFNKKYKHGLNCKKIISITKINNKKKEN